MNTDKIYAEAIANEYSKKSASKVMALKKLDRRAKLPGNVFAYTFGVLSTLLLGVGMCLSMKVLGNGSLPFMVLGLALGLLGIAGVTANYFIYKKILAKNKEKYAGDIIRLAAEISGEED